MKSSKIAELDVVASRMEKTLKTISRASISATRLSTGAIYGSLGFTVGAGGTFGVLAAASMLVYAPFAVPLLGMCGLLAGVLISRDGTDRANERSVDLVQEAWMLRDQEADNLTRQIDLARRAQSPGLQLLEKKLTFLLLARPDELIVYYRLSGSEILEGEYHASVVGQAEQQILEAWKSSAKKLPSLRDGSDSA